jgi:hypothetical protein
MKGEDPLMVAVIPLLLVHSLIALQAKCMYRKEIVAQNAGLVEARFAHRLHARLLTARTRRPTFPKADVALFVNHLQKSAD